MPKRPSFSGAAASEPFSWINFVYKNEYQGNDYMCYQTTWKPRWAWTRSQQGILLQLLPFWRGSVWVCSSCMQLSSSAWSWAWEVTSPHSRESCDLLHMSSLTRKANGQKRYFTSFLVFVFPEVIQHTQWPLVVKKCLRPSQSRVSHSTAGTRLGQALQGNVAILSVAAIQARVSGNKELS